MRFTGGGTYVGTVDVPEDWGIFGGGAGFTVVASFLHISTGLAPDGGPTGGVCWGHLGGAGLATGSSSMIPNLGGCAGFTVVASFLHNWTGLAPDGGKTGGAYVPCGLS